MDESCTLCMNTQEECTCVYHCEECESWHISDEVLKKMGITEDDLASLKELDDTTE